MDAIINPISHLNGLPPVAVQDWIKQRLARTEGLPVTDGRQVMAPAEIAKATPASVLVPLLSRAEGVTVLLTQRTSHLTDHAGQISFPGGRVEPGDVSAQATALRESEEEIGLPRNHVTLLGELPTYYIPTGFKVTPVVGWVDQPFALRLDPFEVAGVFEVPLEFILEPANHQIQSAIRAGRERQFYAIAYAGHNIWGATAGMLVSFYHALRG